MDRKNFLFANTPNGAHGSAVIFSMIETAKENGLDPYRYLVWVLQSARLWQFLALDGRNCCCRRKHRRCAGYLDLPFVHTEDEEHDYALLFFSYGH